MSGAPRGWYPDPRDAHKIRYYDGGAWTNEVRDRAVVAGSVGATAASATTQGGADARWDAFVEGYDADARPFGAAQRTTSDDLVVDPNAPWGSFSRIPRLIDVARRAVTRNLAPLLGMYAIGAALTVGIGSALILFLSTRLDDLADDFVLDGDAFSDAILTVLAGFGLLMFLLNAVTLSVTAVSSRLFILAFAGEPVSLRRAWRDTSARLVPLVILAALWFVLVGFAASAIMLAAVAVQTLPILLLLVPVVAFAWVKLAFLPIAAAATRHESIVKASFSVSSRGGFFPVFGRMVGATAPFWVIQLIINLLGRFVVDNQPVSWTLAVAQWVLSTATIAFATAALTRIYLESGAPREV